MKLFERFRSKTFRNVKISTPLLTSIRTGFSNITFICTAYLFVSDFSALAYIKTKARKIQDDMRLLYRTLNHESPKLAFRLQSQPLHSNRCKIEHLFDIKYL